MEGAYATIRGLKDGYFYMPFVIFFIMRAMNNLAARQTAYKVYKSPSGQEDTAVSLNYLIMVVNGAALVGYRFFGFLACAMHPQAHNWYKAILDMNLSFIQVSHISWAYVAPWTVVPDDYVKVMIFYFAAIFIVDKVLSSWHWDTLMQTSTIKWAHGAKVLKLRDTGVTFASLEQRVKAMGIDTAIVVTILAAVLTAGRSSGNAFVMDIFTLPRMGDWVAICRKILKVVMCVGISSGIYTMVTGSKTVGRTAANINLVGPDGAPIGTDMFTHTMRVVVSALLTPSVVDTCVSLFGADQASVVDALTGTRILSTLTFGNGNTAGKDDSAAMKVFSPKKKPPAPVASAATTLPSPKKANASAKKSPAPKKASPVPKRKSKQSEPESESDEEPLVVNKTPVKSPAPAPRKKSYASAVKPKPAKATATPAKMATTKTSPATKAKAPVKSPQATPAKNTRSKRAAPKSGGSGKKARR
jgi:hypothetical protein